MGQWEKVIAFRLHCTDKVLTRYTDGLEMECERKKEVRDDTKQLEK